MTGTLSVVAKGGVVTAAYRASLITAKKTAENLKEDLRLKSRKNEKAHLSS